MFHHYTKMRETPAFTAMEACGWKFWHFLLTVEWRAMGLTQVLHALFSHYHKLLLSNPDWPLISRD